jgi:hypothetical protein
MDLRDWLLDDLDDGAGRLRTQVFGLVPPERRGEHPGGGNSILYAGFHVARHADLALAALTGTAEVGGPYPEGGLGLEEAEPGGWPASDNPADVAPLKPTDVVPLDPVEVEAYLTSVLERTRGVLAAGVDLDAVPSTEKVLEAAGVPTDRFAWLYRMWVGQPAAWLVRWPLLGHVANHTGEMIATRNRMGLSPF